MEESEINPEVQDKVESLTDNASEQSINTLDTENVESDSKSDSVFKRILENGFDGITTNPNYKLLALLIILLINLSLFFLVGNLGKTFLKNSGILGWFYNLLLLLYFSFAYFKSFLEISIGSLRSNDPWVGQ